MPKEYVCILEHPDEGLGLEWLEKEAYTKILDIYKKNGYKERVTLRVHWERDFPEDIVLAAYLNCADYVDGRKGWNVLVNYIKELKAENNNISVLLPPQLHSLQRIIQ